MTREEIRSLVEQLMGIVGVLQNAHPDDRRAIYQELNVSIRYHTDGRIHVKAGPRACTDECVGGDFNFEYTRSLGSMAGCRSTPTPFGFRRSRHGDVGVREVVTNEQERLTQPPRKGIRERVTEVQASPMSPLPEAAPCHDRFLSELGIDWRHFDCDTS